MANHMKTVIMLSPIPAKLDEEGKSMENRHGADLH
jgi:hypothetical protein